MLMTSKFRSNVWDPCLIIFQIISMQLQYYFTLSIIIFIFYNFLNIIMLNNQTSNLMVYSLDHLFNYKLVSFVQLNGRLISLAFVANSIVRYILNETIHL